jgi:hypothetical protein
LKSGTKTSKNAFFFALAQILAVFEPVVGDFCEIFFNEGFFRQSPWDA